MQRTVDYTRVGDTFTVREGKGSESTLETYKVTRVYRYFVDAANIRTGRRESFCLGDLVIFGLEPGDIFFEDADRNKRKVR